VSPVALMYALVTLQSPCLHYTPQVVDLQGTLVASVRYGPPNYGENPTSDKRIQIWLLKFSQPVRMCTDSTGAAVDSVRQMEIFFKQSPARYRGKLVQVRGTIEQATLGPQFTPIVLYAQQVRSNTSQK
jgi:hypothetical protein